jgi:hypothetical protein
VSFRTLKLNPGVNTVASASLNETQWAASNLIRFYGGLPSKVGGWQHLNTVPIVGTCRGMLGWSDNLGNPYIACGTEQRLQVLNGGVVEDITPVVETNNPAPSGFSSVINTTTITITDTVYQPSIGDWINLITQVSVGGVVLWGLYQVDGTVGGTQYTVEAASPATSTASGGVVPVFTTTNGSATVNVLLPSHGEMTGNSVAFLIPTTVGGLTVGGIYSIASVVDANNFTISAATAATSAASASMNAGNAQIEYLLPTGFAVNTYLTGYGIGDYGMGDYGLGTSGSNLIYLRQWSMDHWGQYLLACPSNGPIYYWNPPVPVPAQIISSNAPTMNESIFVIPQAQIIVALGAEIGGVQEPLLVRWCDAGDFTDWTASTTNQAGSYQLSSGNRLVGGLPVGLGALLWTDTDVWYMQYIGFPLVFSFTQIANSGGLLAMRTAGNSGGQIAWLSTRGFFRYQTGGGVSAMECPVWDFIFQNLDTTQAQQCCAAVNSLFGEMAWFFPINPDSPIYDPTAPLGYVKFNLIENVWDYGLSSQYQRTAWIEKNPQGYPVGTDLNGFIQQHEVGFDADGTGMIWSYQTGYFSLLDGEEFMFVDLMIPDFVLDWTGSAPPVISVSMLGIDYPIGIPDGEGLGLPLIDGPYTINTAQPGATLMVPVRLRARQIALLFSGSDLGSFSRLGAVRIRFMPDGRN